MKKPNGIKPPSRPTVGKIVTDLSKEAPEIVSLGDLRKPRSQKYLENLLECANKTHEKHEGDFYIVVHTKREKILGGLPRYYFIARRSAPTPTFDQSVYKFNSQTENIEYLWTVPSPEDCDYYMINAHLVVPEEQQLLGMVMNFFDGTLLKMAKKLNKEANDAPTLESFGKESVDDLKKGGLNV